MKLKFKRLKRKQFRRDGDHYAGLFAFSIYAGSKKVGSIDKFGGFNGVRDVITLYEVSISRLPGRLGNEQMRSFGVRGEYWVDRHDFTSGDYGSFWPDTDEMFNTSHQALAAAKKWAQKQADHWSRQYPEAWKS